MRTLLREEAQTRAELLAVASYDVDLDLTGEEHFTSVTVIRFACREPGASSFVELDGTPLSVTLNRRDLGTSVSGNRIALPDLLAYNELRVAARCEYSRTGEGLHRFVDPADGRVYVWGQSATADAQRMYACFDQPDLKAVFRLQVTAPPEWTVLANGRGTQAGGRWTFAPTAPMSTYLFSLSGGSWHGVRRMHDGIELGVWCRQSLSAHLEEDELLGITAQCFDFFHRTFGIRYPYGDCYDQIWVPEMNFGAMENPGAVTFGEGLLFRSRVTAADRRGRAVVIAHEMAHMWFGNLVTMRWWQDLWLNESFADLMGYLTTDRATAFEGAWADFCAGRKDWGYAADQLPTTHPIADEVADSASALLNVDGIAYAKGASALRQLMAALGEDAFFAGLRLYLARHVYGNTTLEDFLAALAESSGRDLTSWALAWLRTPGVSTLRIEGAAVRQTVPPAHPVLRDHHIEIGCYNRSDSGLVRSARHVVDVSGELTPVPGFEPHDLVLVNDADLTFAKVRFDARSLATVLTDLRALPDPLSRAVCWGAVYDATRDAELSATAFVRAVTANAEAEQDPAVLGELLAQAQLAAVSWTADLAAREQLADWLAGSAATAEPGSDRQLTWVRAWVAATGDATALGRLLDQPLAGLAMDTELRWHVLRRLACLGAVAPPMLAAELERDNTAAGQLHAAYVRAAGPDTAAKEQAWELAMRDTSLSNHVTQAYAAGFWQPEAALLCRPWVERYFAEIRSVWEKRTPEVTRAVAALLYPSVVFDQEVMDRTDAFLADETLPPGLRRVVLERQDDLRRALAARALQEDAG